MAKQIPNGKSDGDEKSKKIKKVGAGNKTDGPEVSAFSFYPCNLLTRHD